MSVVTQHQTVSAEGHKCHAIALASIIARSTEKRLTSQKKSFLVSLWAFHVKAFIESR